MISKLATILLIGVFTLSAGQAAPGGSNAGAADPSDSTDPVANFISKPPMTIDELIIESVRGVGENCLHWCIVGVSFYLVGCPYCSVKTTLRMSHNLPDFAILTHPQIGESPWKEWSDVFGSAQTQLESFILCALTNGIGCLPGGGESLYDDRGRHQSHTSKEAQVVGNPTTLIARLLSGTGGFLPSTGCDTPGCLEQMGGIIGSSLQQEKTDKDNGTSYSDNERKTQAFGYISSFANGYFSGYSSYGSILQVFSYYKSIQTLMSAFGGNGIFSQMANLASMQGTDMSAERLLCPSDTYPFMPYYLSSVDTFFWREGFPVTDLDHASKILNPWSNDKIGPRGQSNTIERWGWLYPRHSTVDNPDDQHAGAVMTVRAGHIVDDATALHFKWPLTVYHDTDRWQPIYPERAECKPHVFDGKISENESYIWNAWRRYTCDMSEIGIYLFTIPITPLCIPNS